MFNINFKILYITWVVRMNAVLFVIAPPTLFQRYPIHHSLPYDYCSNTTWSLIVSCRTAEMIINETHLSSCVPALNLPRFSDPRLYLSSLSLLFGASLSSWCHSSLACICFYLMWFICFTAPTGRQYNRSTFTPMCVSADSLFPSHLSLVVSPALPEVAFVREKFVKCGF